MRGTTPATLAITGATVQVSPDVDPIEGATVVCRDGRIAAVGATVPVPRDATVLSGRDQFLFAGFWNCHVHFTEPRWHAARRARVARLDAGVREMLTSRGFTTVVDLGSDPRSTVALRRRIESGELAGPAIWTAGTGLYPPHGLPYYLRREVPEWVQRLIPQPASPAAAVRATKRNFRYGADLVKLFTGSYVERGVVKAMPEPVARAAVELAHREKQLVFSHPSNLEGAEVARRAGVDVLAHPPDSADGVDASVVRSWYDRGMSLVPTLKMFGATVTKDPRYLEPIYAIVRRFHELGGSILFGTDVGYMADYSTEDEFRALAASGLDPGAILAALTTAPARRFGLPAVYATIARGAPGDLVLLPEDPRHDVTAFARPSVTIRAGRVIYATA
jgi:imidazolonepropionase-like amidohydrolase